VRVGYEQGSAAHYHEALATLAVAKRIAAANGAKTLAHVDMAAQYAESAGWQVTYLLALGRNAEARRVGDAANSVADRLLEERPGYRLALHATELIDSALGSSLTTELRPREALPFLARAEATSMTLVHLDPSNTITRNNLAVAHSAIGDAYWALGRLRTAATYYRDAVADGNAAIPGGFGFVMLQRVEAVEVANRIAKAGDYAGARASLLPVARAQRELERAQAGGGFDAFLGFSTQALGDADIDWHRGDAADAVRLAAAAIAKMQSAHASGGVQQYIHDYILWPLLLVRGEAQVVQGNYREAARSLRDALAVRTGVGDHTTDDRRDLGRISTWLALALGRGGHAAEARTVIEPVVMFQCSLAARNHGDEWQPVELAAALYAEALAEPRGRGPRLRAAAALLERVPAQIRATYDVRLWRRWIAAAIHATPAGG
jgi:tetratricopeptide (TPR) repeat protein